MSNLKNRRKSYHNSFKAGLVYCDSSYEIKAALILDNDPSILTYENHKGFTTDGGKKRVIDFLVTYKDLKKKIIEVKPFRRMVEFAEQLKDNVEWAEKNGYGFEVWTEAELGFSSEHDATKWADHYLSNINKIDYVEGRKALNRSKANKHYASKIATDTIEVWCEFCKENHKPLKLTYDKNITRNSGQYICEKHGGFIAGSKPKKKKENIYAVDGKKQCNGCQDIKPFEDFGIDGTKSDGYSTRCKTCRAKVAKARYQQINLDHSTLKEINIK